MHFLFRISGILRFIILVLYSKFSPYINNEIVILKMYYKIDTYNIYNS